MSIREEVERSWNSANATIVKILHGLPGWPQDVRYQWPLKIFERVCSCHEGWGGYDCSQCDFGFIANEVGECVERNASQLLVRRNFMYLNKKKRFNYIKLIEAAKNEEDKKWATITSVPEEENGYYSLQNVSTYDMLVFTHFLSIKEKVSEYCPNVLIPNATESTQIHFAHYCNSFLPWHRYFLMIYENELRRIGDRMGIGDFTLPYWDWTPTGTCHVFTHELFGLPERGDEAVNVSGATFENGMWPVVCDLQYWVKSAKKVVAESAAKCAKVRTLCDVEGDRMANRRLQRGTVHDITQRLRLPDYKTAAMTLPPDQFEGTFGFANRLEGHVEQCAGEAVKCMYSTGGGLNIHSLVHEYVGGHLSFGAESANDPVFFLHHGNVDRIFERWLQKYNRNPPSYQPINGGPPGQNLNDYFVPLFPLKRIADVYKASKELGYTYDDLPWSIPEADYQVGCPSAQCNKGGYPLSFNATSAYCTRIQMDTKSY